jgi:Flp pilus assembly protein TadB
MSTPAWPDLGMRVSDADRSEVADRLARHFGDGRLDQAEFDQRLDQAMRAKTRADLVGLLADLPQDRPAPDASQPAGRKERRQYRQLLNVQLERERLILKHERREQRRRERGRHWYSISNLPVFLLIILVIVMVTRVLRDIYSIWLVLAVLAFIWFRYADRRR